MVVRFGAYGEEGETERESERRVGRTNDNGKIGRDRGADMGRARTWQRQRLGQFHQFVELCMRWSLVVVCTWSYAHNRPWMLVCTYASSSRASGTTGQALQVADRCATRSPPSDLVSGSPRRSGRAARFGSIDGAAERTFGFTRTSLCVSFLRECIAFSL